MANGLSKSGLREVQLLESSIDLLSSEAEPGEIVPQVLAHIAAGLPCDRLATFEFHERLGGYRLVHSYALTPASRALLEAQVFPPGEPFEGLVHRGEVLVANDVATQRWLAPEFCTLAEISCYVAAPLRARGRHLGALIAARAPGKPPFSPADAHMVKVLARQIALAVETKSLIAQQRAQMERVQALSAFSRAVLEDPTTAGLKKLCQLIAQSAQCDVHQLWMWDSEQGRFSLVASWGETADEAEVLRALGINPPFAHEWRETLRHRPSIVFPPERLPPALSSFLPSGGEHAGRCLCALFQRREVIGFAYSSLRNAHRLSAAQIELLQGGAQVASLAIEHLRAAEALARADRLKSEFVAAISHELRTPLNVILGYCDLLLEGAFGDLNEEQHDALRRLHLRSRELAELVANTLDFHRIESGQITVQPALLRVSDLLGPVLRELEHLHEPGKVLLSAEVNPPDLTMCTDAAKFRLILKNLVGNALKFTPAGAVRVVIERRGNLNKLEVHDTGIGIPAEVLPTIFDPYRQAHTHSTGSYSGVGLGLFIVHQFVRLLNGSIQVRSEVGRGSTFTVLLPDLES